ncbi:DUF2828 family protein [Clostridium sp. AL.422]|uniref:DUF2828 family protein n=1 Tax=Clostridium TaxID=1485 RepID=UPI00293DDF75|nr:MULTISPECIES: DUF2828 family protein [unclassified Clostridium]MDV4151626.1 DUF2828 family protein [Clostridium sp. AL.422]
MSGVLNKIRKELYKLSEPEMDQEEQNSILALKDFIENIAYLRNASEEEIINKFRLILFLDTEESIKFLFFIRSIKNGLGERRIFRVLLKYLAKENTDIIEKNIRIIPKYGRWDDLYSLFDTPLEEKVIYLFKNQIQKDLTSNTPSTLGKWLKSENSSSKDSRALGYKTRVLLKYSSKEYRKLLTTLRRKLNIIENNLTTKNYENINYENISKISINKYKKAFFKNDNKNYSLYLNNKVNTDYIIPNKIINYLNANMDEDNLNNRIENLFYNIIIKGATNLDDSLIINGLNENENNEVLSLLIFTIVLYKKINLNAFKNYYISFKKNPKFNKLTEIDLINDMKSIYNNYTNFNINLNSALDLLLFTLLKKNLSSDSSPKSILYIYNSDEDIDFYTTEDLKEKWSKANFEIPEIKLWNLNNLNNNFSIQIKDDVIRISGYNQNIWKYLIESKEISNTEIILDKYHKINLRDINI